MGMNPRHNLISQESVWLHCVIKWIRWSHCINNTLSIQYSKCVNRGERLAESSPQAVACTHPFLYSGQVLMTDRYTTDDVETYEKSACVCVFVCPSEVRGKKAEDNAKKIKKSHFVMENVLCRISGIVPASSHPSQHEGGAGGGPQTSYSQISSDNQFKPGPNSLLEILIPAKVNSSESFHVSGRWVHLRLGIFVWSALRRASQWHCWSLQAML